MTSLLLMIKRHILLQQCKVNSLLRREMLNLGLEYIFCSPPSLQFGPCTMCMLPTRRFGRAQEALISREARKELLMGGENINDQTRFD